MSAVLSFSTYWVNGVEMSLSEILADALARAQVRAELTRLEDAARRRHEGIRRDLAWFSELANRAEAAEAALHAPDEPRTPHSGRQGRQGKQVWEEMGAEGVRGK